MQYVSAVEVSREVETLQTIPLTLIKHKLDQLQVL